MLNRLKQIHLNLEEETWLATRAAGAVIADGEMKEIQLKELGKYFDLMESADEPSKAAKETLMKVKPPYQDSLKVDDKKATGIFRIILKVISTDFVLCDKEVAFILQTARLLNLDQAKAKPIIDEIIEDMRFEYFLKLLESIKKEQREWLSAVIIKMIYADKKVTASERSYLNHITQLLDNDFNKLQHMKKSSGSDPLPDISEHAFATTPRKKVFRYLTEIALQGLEFEPQALKVGREAGNIMGLTPKEMDHITQEVLHILPLL
ncbi:MAG: hypothetical protein QNL04_15495 [SAR324 cluster bacterium]|nr:hypothetical protein [SAR324 cluster bacterium]